LAEVRGIKMYFVYFARSLKNNKIYVGSSGKEPKLRVKEHNQSSNQFSKENKPFELIYFEEYVCRADALRREKFYKTGFGRKNKLPWAYATGY